MSVSDPEVVEMKLLMEHNFLGRICIFILLNCLGLFFGKKELDKAVDEEMNTYTEQWQETLDELEDRSSLLQVR